MDMADRVTGMDMITDVVVNILIHIRVLVKWVYTMRENGSVCDYHIAVMQKFSNKEVLSLLKKDALDANESFEKKMIRKKWKKIVYLQSIINMSI